MSTQILSITAQALRCQELHDCRFFRAMGQSVPGTYNGTSMSGGSSAGSTSSSGAQKRSHASRLSSSAPTHLGLEQIWARREPRQHLLSTGSMAEATSTSSITSMLTFLSDRRKVWASEIFEDLKASSLNTSPDQNNQRAGLPPFHYLFPLKLVVALNSSRTNRSVSVSSPILVAGGLLSPEGHDFSLDECFDSEEDSEHEPDYSSDDGGNGEHFTIL